MSATPATPATSVAAGTPTLAEASRVFLRIGLLSFGGPAAQIALMHRELVEERPWLTEAQFLRALSFCMLLPGPEAMQLATYAGWRLHGLRGGLIAGGLFVGPGAVLILALALAYASVIDLGWVQAVFLGVKATVVAIVVEAILKVARRALKRPAHWVLAGLAFVALFAFGVPFPVVVLAAGLWGAATATGSGEAHGEGPVRAGPLAATLAGGLVLWWLPVAIAALAGAAYLLQVGLFLSELAVVTFGGAYAVLSYMAQAVVDGMGWVSTGQLMDALGLAETTPGPLILVTTFVAALGGIERGGAGLGLLAGLMALWVTFVPCFLWIFAGAPFLDRLSATPRLQAALAAITAAVVGVILNLSVWFAIHTLFAATVAIEAGIVAMELPALGSFRPVPAALALLAGWLLLGRHWPLVRVLALSAALALGLSLAGVA